MALLFLWQTQKTFEKFNSKQTVLQESLEDTGEVLYPSISFCAKYIWDQYPGLIDHLQQNKSTTFEQLKEFALQNHWTIEKTFNFVSHQKATDKSFPCNTIGGPSEGKPCKFPFFYKVFGNNKAI